MSLDENELNRLLGQLVSESKEGQRQRAQIFGRLQYISEHMVSRKEFDAHVKEASVLLNDYRSTKAKAVGVLITVAFLGALAWEGVKHTLEKIGIH